MGKRGPAKRFTDAELKERKRARDRLRYAANLPRMREKNRKYYEKNKARENERCRAYHWSCRDGRLLTKKQYYQDNAASLSQKRKEWRKNNRASLLEKEKRRRELGVDRESRAKWESENREWIKERSAEWVRKNRALVNAKTAKRRANRKLATPKWANLENIKSFYEEADRLTRETGVRHEVDHIYPLTSPIMCGLHVEFNLRVIPYVENRRKHNRIIEATWDEAIRLGDSSQPKVTISC